MPKINRISGLTGYPRYEDFWKWLQGGPRNVVTLGGRKRFEVVAVGDVGQVMREKKRHPFKKSDAEKTWIRYQGVRLAMLVGNVVPPMHMRAGTYELPSRGGGSLNSWAEVPNMICCPWIAAAIARFLGEK